MDRLPSLLVAVRDCRHCERFLPHEPRPIVQAGADARVVIIGQAPGSKVHASGVPWDDPSGERLRAWLGVDRAAFYDTSRFALVPMGFCYPGAGTSGDLPPRPECAPLWHARLLGLMKRVRLTVLVGAYAQAAYLPAGGAALTDNVRAWRDALPRFFPLPHPSPRNGIWLRKHTWFEREAVPELRNRVAEALEP